MAHCKLLRTTNDSSDRSLREFSYQRTAEFDQNVQEGCVQASISPFEENDKLLCNEAARRTYRTFRKFEVHEKTETSILSIARLDANLTTIIDSVVDEQGMSSSISAEYCNATADVK